jgi:hypothetical protein
VFCVSLRDAEKEKKKKKRKEERGEKGNTIVPNAIPHPEIPPINPLCLGEEISER